MNPELRDLYQQVIVDHGKRPRNFHKLSSATHHAEGFNPLCGDRVDIHVEIEDGTIQDLSFEGVGCAICKASTSLMTQAVVGKTTEDVDSLFRGFHAMLTEQPQDGTNAGQLGKLAVFSGVCKFPMRVKCATLPWHTLLAALEGVAQTVTTE